MKQYTLREFIRALKFNGFHYDRHSGSHAIYMNDKGKHISVPHQLKCVIALRLIKENNLVINAKEKTLK